jgi:hypothetical protein
VLIGVALAALLWGGAKVISKIRGIRNNNPGNIELGNDVWVGQVPPEQQTDSRFVQFIAPEYGIRAMARILSNYMARGLVTVNSIIRTWSETDQDAYVEAVSDDLGVDENAPLSMAQLPALIAAMIDFENGEQPYSSTTIAKGVSMA